MPPARVLALPGRTTIIPRIILSYPTGMSCANNHVRPEAVSFAEAFRFWLKLGFISFGGPAGQIAVMHQELVERRRWISSGSFCMP